jgi:hypothetical protein
MEMRERTLEREPGAVQPLHAIEEEGSGGALAQALAFGKVARESADACKKKDEAQQELTRRRNGPGQ